MMQGEGRYDLTSSSWSEEEQAAIQRVMGRGRFTMGEEVKRYEEEFARKFGARYAVMVNSGSSANLLVIAALVYKRDRPLQRDDEVIVPSLSWPTTFYPVHQYGLKLVFVDIDLNTLNLTPKLLEAARSERTRAVLVPNILGNPARLLEIKEFCEQHGLYLVEDNCESMGAHIDGTFTGTFGVCGTFSTFFSHHISTMEGGVIVTDDEEIYHLLLSLRSHGWTRHLPAVNRLCNKSDDDFYESFRFILPGYNVRPTELSGAVGVEQLKKLDGFIENRRSNAAHFMRLFGEDQRFILQDEHGTSSWFAFSMILRPDCGLDRHQVVKVLHDAHIEARPVVAGNFLANDVIHHLNHRVAGAIINAQLVHDRGFYIGNHHFDIRDKIDYLHTVLKHLERRPMECER